MVEKTLKLTKAEIDCRHKTPFIHVEGQIIVESYEDEVVVVVAEPQGFNPSTLLLNVVVHESNGPKKPQPATFDFREVMTGNEAWTHVQAESKYESDTLLITKLVWAEESPSCKHDAKKKSDTKEYTVIALSTSVVPDKNYEECSVIEDDAVYPAIYSQVFGPDTKEACEQWITNNCTC